MQDVSSNLKEPRYRAFISYSHSDRRWGERLHQWLETYRIPAQLVGTESRHGGRVPARLFPVFRDRAELPSTANLNYEIEEALADSQSLIVVCSPRSAHSRWVEEEIFRFKQMGGEERTFGLIVEGTPFASEGSEEPGRECFPRGLRTRIGPGKRWTDQRLEPGAADARPGGDGERDAFLKVAAAVAGVNFNALKQRDERRQRQRLLFGLAASLALAILFATLAGIAYSQWRSALQTLSRSDSATALRRLADGDARGALAFLARAVRSDAGNLAARERLGALLVQRRWPVPELSLQGDGAEFFAATCSRDGRTCATKDLEGRLRFWDVATGSGASPAFPGLSGEIVGGPGDPFAFSPDGRLLATGDGNGVVRVWRDDGKLAWASSRLDKSVQALSFSRDNSRLAAATTGSGVQIWRVAEGPGSQVTFPHPADTLAVAFDPSGTRLATGSMDQKVRLWDLAMARTIASFDEGERVAAVDFSPDGSRLLTGVGYYGSWTVRLRNIATEEIVWTVVHPLGESAMPIGPSGSGDARFSPDGRRVLSLFTLDRSVRIWNAADGSPAAEPASHRDLLRTARFSPDGNRIVTTARDGLLRVWRLPSPAANNATRIGREEQIGDAILFPEGYGGAAVLSRGEDHWRLVTLDLRHRPRIAASQALPGRAFLAAADARHIAVESTDGAVQVFGAKALEPLVRIENGASVTASALRDKAMWIARQEGEVQSILLDGTGKVHETRLPSEAGSIRALAVDPASQNLLLATESGRVFLWPQGSRVLREIGRHDLTATLALAIPGGGTFVTGGYDGQVRRWRADGTPLAPTIRHSADLVALASSRDGRTLVTGARDDTARWWDLNTASSLAAPVRLSSWCTSIMPSPSGESFLIGDLTGTLRLRSSDEALPLADPLEEIGKVITFGWHGDGADALAILTDGTVRRRPLRLPIENERAADLAEVAEALSDLRLNEHGGIDLKEPAGRGELTAILARLPSRSALRRALR